jgi:hypothetical protein
VETAGSSVAEIGAEGYEHRQDGAGEDDLQFGGLAAISVAVGFAAAAGAFNCHREFGRYSASSKLAL